MNITFNVLTNRDTTRAMVDCGDFYLNMNAKGGYEHLLSRFEKFGSLLSKEISDGHPTRRCRRICGVRHRADT